MAEKIMHYSLEEILKMDKRFRATFINSLGGFKSVVLIGSKSKDGYENLAIFNSIVHIGATPPLIGFIVRPDSVERHTLENILETKCFTFNHINEDIIPQAHQTSARYPKETSEFEAVGLSPEYKSGVNVPFVLESNIQIEMEFKEKIDININGTLMIIGEVKNIYLPKEVIKEDGFIDLENSGTITCSGLDSYHRTERIVRLPYAKPKLL